MSQQYEQSCGRNASEAPRVASTTLTFDDQRFLHRYQTSSPTRLTPRYVGSTFGAPTTSSPLSHRERNKQLVKKPYQTTKKFFKNIIKTSERKFKSIKNKTINTLPL